mgnify:FL=1
MTASAVLGSFILQKEEEPIVQTRITGWGYDAAGNVVLRLSVASGNMQVERSADAVHWSVEPSAVVYGTTVTIPASVIAGQASCYFRIRQW